MSSTFKEQLVDKLKKKYEKDKYKDDTVVIDSNLKIAEGFLINYFENLKNKLEIVCYSSKGKVKIIINENDEIIARIIISNIGLYFKKGKDIIEIHETNVKNDIYMDKINKREFDDIIDYIELINIYFKIDDGTVDYYLKQVFEKIVDKK